MTERLTLAYCGYARPRSNPKDLVHAYLKMPETWKSTGAPARSKANAIAFRSPISNFEIGDVFTIEVEVPDDELFSGPGTFLFHTAKWVDGVAQGVANTWRDASEASKRDEKPPASPVEAAVATLRGHYFDTREENRAAWLDAIVSGIKQP